MPKPKSKPPLKSQSVRFVIVGLLFAGAALGISSTYLNLTGRLTVGESIAAALGTGVFYVAAAVALFMMAKRNGNS